MIAQITEQNGLYLVCTHSQSRWFKTLVGAMKWIEKLGYTVGTLNDD